MSTNATFIPMVFQQFELDIEPKVFLKPSRASSTEALTQVTQNESQEFSFSEATTKGMQPLSETVSEFEMLARAGKDHLHWYPCSLLPFHLYILPFTLLSLLLASRGTCITAFSVFQMSLLPLNEGKLTNADFGSAELCSLAGEGARLVL